MIKKISQFIVRSPLHKTAVELKAFWISSNLVKESSHILGHRTVYCISPYKTGTKFLASSFDSTISKHEPFHYTSLIKLNQDFDSFFVRRLNSLNLKLECSGFLSAYVENLAHSEITRDLTYLCVLRKPSLWVTSVVNHYQKVRKYGHHYLWINELFWKKHVGVDVANFFMLDESEKLQTVEKMIAFYMSFTRKTGELKYVHYVWIEDITGFLPTLGQLIGEEAKPDHTKKNKTKERNFVYENIDIDTAYEQLVAELMAQR